MAGVSVLIPCYNEAEALAAFETELFPALRELGAEFEVVAVDDGSTDGTRAALDALAARHPELVICSHGSNRGLGAALRTGLSRATGDRIVFLDADLTFHPRLIGDLLAAQQREGADCVGGSPFLGSMGGVPWPRRLPSLALNAFYRGLFSMRLTSYTPMFRLYRVSALRELELESDGFEISAEILVKLLKAGRKIAEVPVALTTRAAGESKLRRLREFKNHARLILRLLA